MLSRVWAVGCVACFFAMNRASGMTIIPPASLAELGKDSHAVVLARAQGSRSIGEELAATRTTFSVEEALSGVLAKGMTFEVETPGGVLGDEVWVVPGSPSFETSETYLLCLLQPAPGVWIPRLASYGILKQVLSSDGRKLLTPLKEARFNIVARPDGRAVEPVTTYRKTECVKHLLECLSGTARWDRQKAWVEELPLLQPVTPAGCNYFFISSNGVNYNFRWFDFDSGGSISMAADQSNDAQVNALSIVPGALGTWNSPSIPSSSIKIVYTGTVAVSPNCSSADAFTMQGKVNNTIVFNDPCHAIPDLTPTGGVLAQGGFRAGLQGGNITATKYAADDCTFWARIEAWFVLVNNGIWGGSGLQNLTDYQHALAHEIGHGLGFDHVADPNALMNGTCCHALDGTDVTCAEYAYAKLVPGISASSTSLDFGTVNVGATPAMPINLRSVGTQDLSVTSFVLGGTNAVQFSVSAPGNATVAPCASDPSFNIQVSYKPSAAGTHAATLAIASNDPDSSPLTIQLKGKSVAPEVDVTPSSLDFGAVRVGVPGTRKVTIKNVGTASLSVTSIALQFGNRGFAKTAGAANTTLAPQGSVTVDVTFTPTATGLRSDALVVRSSDGDEATINVSMSGTGVQPLLEVTPSTLVFGDVQVGASKLLKVKLQNTGSALLSLGGIFASDGTSVDFGFAGPPANFLEPGENFSLDVTYAPKDAGADSGGLVIASDDPAHPQTTVPLTGNGTQPPGGLQVPGDCNQDGAVDISDPVCLLGFLFLGHPTELPCGTVGLPEPDGPAGEADVALLDWNGDGKIDLSDVVASLNSQFSGGPPHVLDTAGTGRSCVRLRGCPGVCTQ